MSYWQMSLDRQAAWCMVAAALILTFNAIMSNGSAWTAYYACAAAWFAWVNADKSRTLYEATQDDSNARQRVIELWSK